MGDVISLVNMRRLILSLLVFAMCSVNAFASEETKHLVNAFRAYQASVQAGESGLSRFFSRETLEYYVNVLTKESGEEASTHNASVVRRRMEFGRLLGQECHLAAAQNATGGQRLIVAGYAAQNGKPVIIEVDYVSEEGNWKISLVTQDVTSAAEEKVRAACVSP